MRIDEVIGEVHVSLAVEAVPCDYWQKPGDAERNTAQPTGEGRSDDRPGRAGSGAIFLSAFFRARARNSGACYPRPIFGSVTPDRLR